MNKTYSVLTIKLFDEDEGVFVGIASTPKPDRVNDIVDSKGISAPHMPVPLLWQHDHGKPAGIVESMTATAKGLEVVCRVLKDASAEVKSYWEFVKAGAVSLSIGFKPIEQAPLANGGTHFTRVELLELSLVTVPAHQDARILSTKAAPTNVITITKDKAMTIQEQIQQFEQKRAELIAKMDTLVTKGATLAGQDETDYKAHEAEIVQIDTHLDRLKAAEARQAATAAPVIKATSHIQVTDNAPKGTDFIKYVRAVGLSQNNPMQALEIAKTMKAGDRVETVLKAAVAAGSTTDANFASLLPAQTMAGEFIDLLRPATILGKLSQVRHVPFNMHFPKAVSGTSVSWVGEGKSSPLTNMAFSDVTITEHKLSAIVPFTEELLRRSEPSVDGIIQRSLIEGISQAVDIALIDPANAGVAGAKPAAVTNGATTAAASGTNAAAVRADVKAAYTKFIVANHPLSSGVWVMNPATALALSMMRNANGAKEFEGISMDGGTFEGLPVVTSTNVPGDGTAGYTIVLAVQSDIFVAEGGLAIDLSREASLEMDGAPTSNSTTPTGASMVSMFQTHSVAIRAARSITWAKRRPTAVTYITAAKYA